jgi:phosphatidylserine decarboxylase
VRIAPEGWPFIATAWTLAAGAALVAARWGGAWWVMPAVLTILAIWVVAFFREGKVLQVIEVDEPMYLKERAVRITVFLSVFDVHVNRYPVGGTVELVHYNPGRFLHAADEKASLENEQSSVGLRGPRGRVLVRQIAGLIARRIVTDGKPGERAAQASRLGLIRFGSRTDVFLPLSAKAAVKVKPGDRVRVGATVLAEYP